MKKIILTFAICFFAFNLAHSEDLLDKGKAYLQARNFQKAIETLNKYLEKDTLSSDGYYTRGLALLYVNAFDAAAEDFTKSIRYNSKQPDAYNNRGLCYNFLGYVDNALADFNSAISLDPKFGEAYINRAGTYMTRRNYDSALSDLKKAEKLSPENPELYFQFARVNHITEKYADAVKYFTKAISLGMTNYKIYYNRGNSYYKMKEYNKAIEDYTKALKGNPKDVEVLNNRSAAYNTIGKDELAEKDRAEIKKIQYKKFPPPDSIKYADFSDKEGNVKIKLPAKWYKIESNQNEDIQYIITRDSISPDTPGFEVGVTIGVIKNFAAKAKAKTEIDMIGAWKQILEDNSMEMEKYQLISSKQMQQDGHTALLRQTLTKEKLGVEFVMLEYCVPVGADLVYGYFQAPSAEFDYWEIIYDKALKTINFSKLETGSK